MDKKIWNVYKHTSPSGKVYIGVTSRNPIERWANGKGYHHNPYFTNAINKYGWDNIKHEILITGISKKEAEDIEIYLISKYNSTDRLYGYNISSGGHARNGIHISDETKEKIGKANKGKNTKTIKQYDVELNLMNIFQSINEASRVLEITASGISECAHHKQKTCNGYIFCFENDFPNKDKLKRKKMEYSEDNKIKASERFKGENNPNYQGKARKGVNFTEEHKNKIRNKLIGNKNRGRRVVQYDLNKNYLDSYETIKEASKMTMTNYSSISKCCQHIIKSAGGYIWEYEDE